MRKSVLLVIAVCAATSLQAWAQEATATPVTNAVETVEPSVPAPTSATTTPPSESNATPTPSAPEKIPATSTNAPPATGATTNAVAAPPKPRPDLHVPASLKPSPEFANQVYIGHRYYEEKGGGWGWLKKPNESWSRAQWIALKETPGKVVAPWRREGSRSSDHNYEYRLYGEFSKVQAYDPHRDETMPIFVLHGYEPLGEAPALKRKPGPPMRYTRSKRSRASGRSDRPIHHGPDADMF